MAKLCPMVGGSVPPDLGNESRAANPVYDVRLRIVGHALSSGLLKGLLLRVNCNNVFH